MRFRSLILAGAALAAGAAAPALALANRAPTPPVGLAGVQSAALTQDGRSLTWTVTLAHGISRRAIASQARRLCLQLETPRTHVTERTLCLTAPTRSTRFGLASQSGAHPIPATISRSDHAHTLTASFSPTALGLPWRSLRWQVQSSARGRGCPVAHAADASHRVCTEQFPARRAPLAALHTPQLVGCVPAGPSLVYHGPSDRREIALSFDDGPWDDPPSIDFVSELKRLGVTGTFFEIGDQISEFDPTGSVERAMLADGDMIGNHTWTHPEMTTLPVAQQTSELVQTNQAIHKATGFTPCLWRPPYGDTSPALESLARSLGMLTVMWDIDPRDWSLPGTGSIVATVLQESQDGGITEMHFGGGPREETLQALPQIVSDLRARGYHFVNLVQMLGLREIWR